MVNAPPIYPAPTLQEILAELPLGWCFGIEHHGDYWISFNHECCIQERDPNTAALKLWMKLKGTEA
jgi:hypothetical protein